MDGQVRVAVVEPDDHPDREHVLAHRVDERAAELVVLRLRAQRPAHRVHHPAQRLRDLPDLLHAERPDLRALALEPERVDRDSRQVALRALAEDRDAREDVRARLEVREPLAEAAASLVAGSHSDDAPVLDEQLLRDGLRKDRRARLLGLLREPAGQLRQRGDVVPVVLHRRRRRDPQRAVVPQEVDALGLDLAVERHVRGPLLTAEQAPEAARVDDRAGERVRARLLALLEHGHRNLAQPLRKLRRLLDQLAEPDRAGEPGGARADDQDPDLDPLVGRIRRLVDELARVELRRILGGPGARHQVLRCFTSSVSFGTISCTSPTTPRSQNSKIGAFGSLLIATTVPEPCMPTLCWIAPEIPQAT